MMHPSLLAKTHYFLAVAETLSFRKAAEKLGVAQPALSRSIRQLEKQLGFPLFERSTRRVALTPAGELLYRDGAEAMQRLSRTFSRAGALAQGLSGTVMVGYSTFAAAGPMSDIIIEFRKQYPDARVGLRLLASSEQSAALDDGTIDLGFMMSVVASGAQLLISREPLIALVPVSHTWANRKSITLRQLSSVPIVIGTETRWRGFRKLIDDMTTAKKLTLKVVEEADDLPVLLQLVRSGFGCTILDASFIATLPPGIRSVDIKDAKPTLDISLVWRKENSSPLTARFVDVAKGLMENSHKSTGAARLRLRQARSTRK